MKKLAKIIAMTLAVLMLAAMTAVTCGAVSDAKGTVTVEKAVVDENLKFYRVLDYVLCGHNRLLQSDKRFRNVL